LHEEREPPAAPRRRGRKPRHGIDQLSEGWAPDVKHIALGKRLGFTAADTLAEVGPWVDYHTGAGTLIADFDGSFRTWLRRSAEFRRNRPGAPPAPKPTSYSREELEANATTRRDPREGLPPADLLARMASVGTRAAS
jgi:hypothetical protein